MRIVHLLFLMDSPILRILIIDSGYYHQWAVEILNGNILGEGVFFMAPLYPYMMALIYLITPPQPMAVALAQILLSGGALWLIYKIADRVSGSKAALAAVWAGALYPVWIYFDGVILTASLILFLNTASLWFLSKSIEKPKKNDLFLAGIFSGLSALARPSALLFGGAVLVWMFAGRRPKEALITGLAIFLVILPVFLRNLAVSGEPALVTASAGMNFYVGNSTKATGLYYETEFLQSAEPQHELNDYILEAEQRTGQGLTAMLASRFWFRQGVNDLSANLRRAVKLYGSKIFYTFNSLEAPNNVSYYVVKDYSPILKMLPWGFGILLAGGIAGLTALKTSRKRNLLLIFFGCIAAANLLFFTSSEFRFQFLPVLLIGLGILIVKIWEAFRGGKMGWKMPGVFLVLLLFSSYQTSFARFLKSPRMDYFNFGSVSLLNGNFRGAEEYFYRSLQIDPMFNEAHIALGTVYIEAGEYKKAARELRAAGFKVTAEEIRERIELNLKAGSVPGDSVGSDLKEE